jgi:ribosomal protein S18 acetylase RimI-like enzyme
MTEANVLHLPLRRVPSGPERERYRPLFALADDSESQIAGYYQAGNLYAFDDARQKPLAIALTLDEIDGVVELKVIAVDAAHQGEGIGRRIMLAVLDDLRRHCVQRVILATSTASIGSLAFYQKVGFRFWKIERDFYTPVRGYPTGLLENGIPLRDQIWLDRDLAHA